MGNNFNTRIEGVRITRKIGRTYKYYLTKLRAQVVTMGLKIKELVVISFLAGNLVLA
jgi:hypothetical protein